MRNNHASVLKYISKELACTSARNLRQVICNQQSLGNRSTQAQLESIPSLINQSSFVS